MAIEKDNFHIMGDIRNLMPIPNVWYCSKEDNTAIDSVMLCNGEKSLRLVSRRYDSEEDCSRAIFYFDITRLEGRVMTITGKYMAKEAEEAKVKFVLQKYPIGRNDTVVIQSFNQPQWTEFSMEHTLDSATTQLCFYIIPQGNLKLYVGGFEAKIDNVPLSNLINKPFGAETDTAFDKGSGIDLGELTPQKIENLEVLCKVWGFLKYYHPEIAQGKYNIDYELFRVLPAVGNAQSKTARNALLNKWVDKYGEIDQTVDTTIKDSTQYSRLINLDWLNDPQMFDDKLIDKLQQIRNAKRSCRFNYYVPPELLLLSDYFEREKPYKNILWNDQGFRILTLFRLWNLIEYTFPYTDYTDTPWQEVLRSFIPKYVQAKTRSEYQLALFELMAKIDDSHGTIVVPTPYFKGTVLEPLNAKYRIPVELTFSSEGDIVVKSTNVKHLFRGDVILSIEGKAVKAIIEERIPYTIASNPNGLLRNILYNLLFSPTAQSTVEVMRDGKKRSVCVDYSQQPITKNGRKSWEKYDLASNNIIHIDNIKSAMENRDIILNNLNSKGLIIDMREYPYEDNMEYLPQLLHTKYPLWCSRNEIQSPGCFKLITRKESNEAGHQQYPCYKGKIVILVDEHTQSAGETWTMRHRLAPNSVVVGRQTAGANGTISGFYLPGGYKIIYSGIGAYYPHWGILQRKGVKIDIPIDPTVEDIKAGRDVWIEKAIEIIEK